jgi:hypothetical protein
MAIALDIWPALPIVIDFAVVGKRPRGMANIIAALKQHNRVCKINIRDIPSSLLKKLTVKKPFPVLTELKISSRDKYAQVVPDAFLAGSAPSLRSLWLVDIPFPTLGKLLLSTSDLVDLGLWKIPHSGYISPEEMVATLSALKGLKKLVLGFQSPRSLDDRPRRHSPLRTCIVLPALTMLYFKGDSEYLEAIVSRIDTPLLDNVKITFFNRLMLDTPLLHHFISRTETLQAPHRAEVIFYTFGVEITLFQAQGALDREMLKLGISCKSSDWQLSALAQVCNSIIPPLHTLELLGVYQYRDEKLQWQDDMEHTQWLEFLHPFTGLKSLVLSETLVQLVAPALQELAGGRVIEVLPVLRNLFLEGPPPSGPTKEAIREFIGARELSACPVTIDFIK